MTGDQDGAETLSNVDYQHYLRSSKMYRLQKSSPLTTHLHGERVVPPLTRTAAPMQARINILFTPDNSQPPHTTP